MNRLQRQETIVPTETVKNMVPAIIGLGAVGKEVATTLASNGVDVMHIFDFDSVEDSNVTTQGYFKSHVGKTKEECVDFFVKEIDPEIQVIPNGRWRPSLERDSKFTHIFSCVDVLSTRGKIHKWYRNTERFSSPAKIFDARLGGENIRLLGSFDQESDSHYPGTITNDNTAYSVGCHVPMIKHSANIAASMLVQQSFSQTLFKDRLFILQTGEIVDL